MKGLNCLFLFVTCFGCNLLSAQNSDVAQLQQMLLGQSAAGQGVKETKPTTHPKAQWYPNAGLGLFIHFGIASVHGGLDLSWAMYANKSWEDGEITPTEYWKLADVWDPKNFDAEEIVSQAKKAGFKYIVFTTKHHDGYTMWPSKYGEIGVKQKLNGRDLVKEFTDACHKYQMKVGLYYSPMDFYIDRNYMNWDFSGKAILDMDHKKVDHLPSKPTDHEVKRREIVVNHIKELLTNYGRIDIFWFDGGQGEISNEEVRKLQPGIVINSRNGSEPGDFGHSEGLLPDRRFTGWFETCDPCWPSRWWSYSTSDRMDTAQDVIERLILLRAWGGNFLANMGPAADGSIPKEALQAWTDMATWMKHSGESIYNVEGGNFPEKDNQPTTVKKDTTYVHVYPNFHKKVVVGDVKEAPKTAVLLRTGEPIAVSFEDGRVEFQIPPLKRTREVDTVRLTW